MTNLFAEKIRLLRNKMNLNQCEFSTLIGIKQPSLSTYERGTSYPSLEVLISIAEKCNVSIDWLCGLESKTTLHTGEDVIGVFLKMKETLDYNFSINEEGEPVITFTGENNNFNEKLCKFFMDYQNHLDAIKTIEDDKIRDDLLKLWLERELKEFETVKL